MKDKLDRITKQEYSREVFSKFKYDYEVEKPPTISTLKSYIQKSF